MTKPLSEARRRRLLVLYEKGVHVTDICAAVGICVATVTKYVRRAGIPQHKPRVGLRNRAAIVSLYRTGAPVAKIVKKTGISKGHIYDLLREAGQPIRSPKRGRRNQTTEANKRRAIKLYLKGVSIVDIARKTGISRPTIYTLLRAAQVRRN